MAGMEVEEARPVAPPFSKVVVGEILHAAQHPNADRLRVCTVNVGVGEPLSIVCGAPNARAGIKVPCALVGAELPPGADGKALHIKQGNLRGVESHGMLCSAKELQLSDDHGGLYELAADACVGQDIRTALALDDTVFTLKLTPNLGHALSVYGIARELAALTGAPLQRPTFPKVACTGSTSLPVHIAAPDLCGRFSGRIVENVNPKAKTPAWMVERLARCGQRSVSVLVDISNYVMFEYGRPTHIFDRDKIHGDMTVRWARAGESLKLLNGNTVQLDEAVGVIADDQAVESLAGIMGGDATAVTDDTRNIYVEAAFWWPAAVAGRSRRFNFATDAGHRFERGVDPATTVEHIEYITQLIQQVCGGADTVCHPIDDQAVNLPKRAPVSVRVARAARVIGMNLSEADCVTALQRLDMHVTVREGVIQATPPSYRFDVEIEEDLIEEIARLIGYDHLPSSPPLGAVVPRVRSERQKSLSSLRRQLAGLGYQETINFSFVNEQWERDLTRNLQPITLLNPISSQMGVMRSSLLGSLLGVLKGNLDRRADRVRVFEIGRVFMRDAAVATADLSVKGVRQPLKLAGLIYGRNTQLQWGNKDTGADFFDLKGDLEALFDPMSLRFEATDHPALHPGRSAQMYCGDHLVGIMGELHPKWRQSFEVPLAPQLFELDLDAVVQRRLPVHTPVSKIQPVVRDLALVVADSVSFDALRSAVQATPEVQGCLQDLVLFDLFRPTAAHAGGLNVGEKSLGLRLTLENSDRTLTEADIDRMIQGVLRQCEQRVQARVR